MHSRIATSISFVSVAAAAVALVAGGCGGAARSADDKAFCRLAAEQLAAERVARTAYNNGELGGPAQFRQFFGPDARYLDANGKLLALSALKGQTRWDYDRWVADLEARPGIGDRMHEARMKVRRAGVPGC